MEGSSTGDVSSTNVIPGGRDERREDKMEERERRDEEREREKIERVRDKIE